MGSFSLFRRVAPPLHLFVDKEEAPMLVTRAKKAGARVKSVLSAVKVESLP